MVQEVVLTSQPPLKQSFYWHLITANFCVLLSFFVLFLCFVILRNYNHLFSIVLLSFCGSHLFDLFFIFIIFVFLFFHYFWLRFKFYLQKCMYVCVLCVFVMTFNIVSVSNSIYGCTFCIYIVIYMYGY